MLSIPRKRLLKGPLELTFSPTINWLTNIELHSINPNYWLPQLTGHLQGKIYSKGSLINNQLIMQNNIAIGGTLRQHKALIKAQHMINNEQWHIPELQVQLGNNPFKGQALVNKQLQAKLNINLAALQQILPDLRGKLTGQMTLAGSMKKSSS